jgi:hypothetical protein
MARRHSLQLIVMHQDHIYTNSRMMNTTAAASIAMTQIPMKHSNVRNARAPLV